MLQGAQRAWPLVVVLTAGLVLRIVVVAAYWPTGLSNRDVWAYVTSAQLGVFNDPLHPPGYAIFLRILHGVSTSAVFPTLVQHLLGLGGAALLYGAARRLGVSRWLAVIPAVALALSGDQLSVEHLLMTDALFGFLVALATYLLVRARTDGRLSVVASVLCGAVLAATYLVRSGGLVVVPLFVGALAYSARRRWRLDWRRPAFASLGFVVALVPVLVVQHDRTGRWNPNQATGWAMYTKAAPFADCDRFDPPDGTEFLCETSDPADRPGPDFYGWDGGPARETFGDFTRGNDELGRFATAAILAQPVDYMGEVLREYARFFVPGLGSGRVRSGIGGWSVRIDLDHRPTEEFVEQTIEAYYDDFTPRIDRGTLSDLGSYQQVVRGSAFWVSAAILAGIAGLFAGSPRQRRWLACLLVMLLASLAFSVAFAVYAWRYAVPFVPIAALIGALGIQAVFDAVRARPSRRPVDSTAAAREPHAPADGVDVPGQLEEVGAARG